MLKKSIIMNKNVTVTANAAGQVVNISKNNPEYGYIRVAQSRTSMEGGWVRTRSLSALISGKVEELKALGLTNGASLPGKIVVSESLTPFNEDAPEKDYKVAGDTGIVCSFEGTPICRKTMYTDSIEATDTLIEHDNREAIQDAYNAQKEAAAASPSEEANL
jgi:hypothetical protein